jgi:hypothetical protein
MENTFEQLVSFICEETGVDLIHINRETLIEEGLGVTGDEAINLIKNFGKRFNVDLNGFQYSLYFYPEPGLLVNYKNVKPIRIGDLEKAIELGVLDEKNISE